MRPRPKGAVAGAQLVVVLVEGDVSDRRGAGSLCSSVLGARRRPARAGPACPMGSEQTRVDHLDMLSALDGSGAS